MLHSSVCCAWHASLHHRAWSWLQLLLQLPGALTADRTLQERDLVRLKREAKTKGGFYKEPEAKLAFVIRIKGLNKVHPKAR